MQGATNSPGDEDNVFALGVSSISPGSSTTGHLAVIVSLHAHKGSHNDHENSAPNTLEWSTSQANVNRSLDFAVFIADRYKNSTAFLGLNLINEPALPTDRDVLKNYYTEAYNRIRATGNRCIILVSPSVTDQDPIGFDGLLQAPAYENVWNEIHPNFVWGYEDKSEQWILDHLNTFKTDNMQHQCKGNRLFIGEWSLAGPPDEKGRFDNNKKNLLLHN